MKFFDKIEKGLFAKAVENDCGDFFFSFDTEKYSVGISLEVSSKKVVNINKGVSAHLCYKVVKVEVLDENNDDVSARYPLVVERLKEIAPDYDDVLAYIRETNMSPEELYFGSTQNYLRYRYGN